MDVVSDVSENHDHSTVSKFIEPNIKILYSDDKASSHMLNMVEIQHHLQRFKSRTITENVQMTGTGSQGQACSVLSHNSESENQRKSTQSHVVVKGLHAVEQVLDLSDTNGCKGFTLSCEESDIIRDRFPEEGCALLTYSEADSPNASGNSVQGTEIGQRTDEILKIAPERPGLKCGEQLLKKNLVLYNLGSNTFSCSESHMTPASQDTEKASVTERHAWKTKSQNGEETLVPESSKSDSLSTNNSKMMVHSEPDMNEATVEEDITQTKDGKSNSSYDSDCTMISESDYMGNKFGAAVENANLHPALTLGSTASKVKGNGKRSFENAFGKSVKNNTENCKGTLTSSIVENSTSRCAAVDSSQETSKVRNDVDVKQQSKAKTKTTKTKKGKRVVSSKKQSTRGQATCASPCTYATSCQAPQESLKVPIRNIHKRNSRGESQLHLASKRGDLALIKALIEAGINVNQPDYAGWTALHEASAMGYTIVAEQLLLAGADVTSRGLEGLTPLHDAVTSNHYETVKLLLRYGSNPNNKNVFGKSALDLECHEPIKELLSTFCGPFICEGSSEPATECQTRVRRKPAAPCLCCETDSSLSGIQPTKNSHGSNEFELIATLGNMEKMQNEISTWELTGPEDTGRFTEAFSEIQTVLNDVLIKHKAEYRELIRKCRIASNSLKQGILREQLTSLASRQKRLLNILQKQNVLKLNVQTQRSRLPAWQSSTQCTLAGEKKSETGILCRINIDPYRITEQEAPLSCHGAVSEETFSSQSISSLGDGSVLHDSSDSTHITSDTESVEPETGVDALRYTEVGMSCENIADNVPHIECEMPETVVCFAPHEIPTGPVQTKMSGDHSLLFSSQQATGSGNDKQRSEVKGTNVLDSCSPQTGFLTVCSNTFAISSFTDNHQISQMPQTRPTALPPSTVNILPPSRPLYQPKNSCQPQGWIMTNPVALNAHETLESTNKCGFRTGDNLQGRVSPCKMQVSPKVQSNMSDTCSTTNGDWPVRCVIDMTSGTTLGVDNQRSALKAAVSTALPQHRDSVDDNRQLIRLIQCGVIKPGDNVLQLTLKGSTYRASLQPDGSIKDTKGQLFLSPEQWIVSFLGPNIPVNSTFAWKTVMYRSKSLSRYLVISDQAAKDSVALQQAFVPNVTPAETPSKEKTAKTSISSFMEINKILLISDDEFMPSHLIDHYWDLSSAKCKTAIIKHITVPTSQTCTESCDHHGICPVRTRKLLMAPGRTSKFVLLCKNENKMCPST
ncbi:hypothetical protein AAFF_G00316450 [Aldrovandia affinis]|uniref:RAMA domain-containing protein n=1 Tax=Aldrovandia affinis TaxID=143900 RepID=A0AAD7SN36_9TELE|nr:hypothetical protein AAFF_G00316450 [Aldrovandia affinis]